MLRALLLLLVSAGPARAERDLSARISVAFGVMDELTWAAPEIDLAGTLDVGERGYVSLAIGYAIVDNHTYFADGRSGRLELAGGARAFGRTRVGATLGVEYLGYHADPDLLTEHPDVDQLELQGGILPTAGIELSHPIGRMRLGAFTRVGLRELTLFETTAGERERARLVLAGVFLALPLR
jgi:hypothetical protein